MEAKLRSPNSEEEKCKKLGLQQLANDRQLLLMRWPFIGGVIMRMELIAVRDDRLLTACTDGNSIYVDINFYSKLTQDERLFVLAHEVWHCVLLHFARKQNRDVEIFNMAADLEIHFALRQEKMREPWVLPHNENWDGLAAEEIYERLIRQKKNSDAQNDGRNSGQSGFDRHIYPENTLQLPEESETEAAEFVVDEEFTAAVSVDCTERIRSRVIASAQQMERSCDKLPEHLQKIIKNLLRPSLPWQEILKQFVSSCFGGKRRWLPPSRRHVWQNLYLPGMREEKITAAVAVDTSGSTTDDLPLFLSELTALMQSFGRYELTVIQCDADIHKVEKFSDSDPINPDRDWEIKGFGGTNFVPVFEYFEKEKEKPELLIYLTDGYGTAPQQPPPYPVLWLLTANGRMPCSWGKKISLSGNHQ